VGIVDSLNAGWTQLLDLLSKIILPDWTLVVGLLPILIVLGVVGPIFTILMLFWLWYFVTKPRRGVVPLAEGPYPAPIGSDGYPIFPAAEPYCYHDALVYPPGSTRCETCGRELLVRCPKCGLGRAAEIDTCGNCGLVLKIEKRAGGKALRPVAGPPPGGGAVA
jgi:hypothetical protein